MSHCGPSFAIPSCASAPVVGFGSPSFGSGFDHGALVPSGVPSASLGVLSGVNPSCINQIPPAEVVIQPPPVVLTLPGPILAATGQPVSMGGNTPCAVSYGGPGRVISGGSFGGFGGRLGSSGGRRGSLILGHRGSSSTCYSPC